MADPINLVPKPQAEEIQRESVKAILHKAMEEAERGEIECVMMVVVRPGGAWLPLISNTDNFSGMMGRFEIAKQEWIADYLSRLNSR